MRRFAWFGGVIGIAVIVIAAAMGYLADALASIQFLFSEEFRSWTQSHGYLLFWCGAGLSVTSIALFIYARNQHRESGRLSNELSTEVARIQGEAQQKEADLRDASTVEKNQLRTERLSAEVGLKEAWAAEVASLQSQVVELKKRLAGPDPRDIKLHEKLVEELTPEFIAGILPDWMPESSAVNSLDPLESFYEKWYSDPTLTYIDQEVQGSLASLIRAVGSFLAAAGNYLDLKPNSDKMQGVPPTTQHFPWVTRDAWIRELREKRDEVVREFSTHIRTARSHGL